MRRPACLWIAVAWLAVPASATDSPANLVLITVDTLRADHVGYHGYARPTTPHLDTLSRGSTVFLNHHSQASRTGPAVASLFTGLHPRSHGVLNPLDELDAKGTLGAERTTLAEVLSQAGYSCYGFVANPNVDGRFGFAQGFDTYELVGGDQAGTDVHRAAFARLADRREPFFVYLHYMEPHSPYAAPLDLRSAFVDTAYRGPFTGSHAELDAVVAGELRPDAGDVRHLEALYDQEILAVDRHLGGLLRWLEERGLTGRTLVAVVADHGEELLDHGSALHGYTLYDEQLRVPFLVHDPRRPVGRRLHDVSRHVDVLPTLLDLLGVAPVASQGRSLAPLVTGRLASLPDVPVFAQATLHAVKTVGYLPY